MDELLSEKEQLEAIRSWWAENGRYIISGIVIGVALLVGWNYWNNKKAEDALAASTAYEALVTEVADGNMESARARADELYANHGSSVYAAQARLAMAKLYMDKGRDQDAAQELRALVASDEDSEAVMIGRLRLAKILLYQDKPQEAIDLLRGYRDTAFAARYSETEGDAYAALGRPDDARDAYAVALADNRNAPTVNRTLVQMKINDLPPAGSGSEGAADLPTQEGAPEPAAEPSPEPGAADEAEAPTGADE